MTDTAKPTEEQQKITRVLARAMMRTDLRIEKPGATLEDFKAAWEANRNHYIRRSRGVLRRLSHRGVSLQVAPK